MEIMEGMTVENRARLFALLAEVFSSPPTEERARGVRSLAQALGISCPAEVPVGEIEREFMKVLVVPSPRYVAPYESAYRDRSVIPGPDGNPQSVGGLLMGDSTVAVRQSFLEAGVLPLRDLPDHVGNELRLVAHLCRVESRADGPAALEAARQRRCFVTDHLLQWIGDLGSRIAQSSETGFYRAAIETADALLRAESAPAHMKDMPEATTEAPES